MATKQPRKYLDDASRMGFMKRGNPSSCLDCNSGISKEQARFWDNELGQGPLDTFCARRRLGSPTSDDKTKSLESLIQAMEKLTAKVDALSVQLVALKSQTQTFAPPAPLGKCKSCKDDVTSDQALNPVMSSLIHDKCPNVYGLEASKRRAGVFPRG